MSLRTRLVLSHVCLILLLGLAAWWGVRRLTTDLTVALGDTAASVGRSVFTVLRRESQTSADATADAAGPGEAVQREVVHLRGSRAEVLRLPGREETELQVIVNGRELSPQEIAARAAHAPHRPLELLQEMSGDVPTLVLRGEGFARTIPLPRSGIDEALQRYVRQLGWGLLALLGIGLLLSVWLSQRIARPLHALAAAAQRVGDGRLGVQAPDGGVPEVRETIAAFNRMSARLQRLDAEAAALRADRELAELGEIGRGLAHSLRNPLHALGLSLEALAAQPVDAARAQYLAQSGREQLQRVDQALRGFLALSAGNGATAVETPLREVVDDVLLEASQRAQGRVRFVRAGDATLDAVAAELRVMLHALVINALEASPDGGTVRVSVGTSDAAGGIGIDVVDEGEGIPPALRNRLFQPHVSGKPHGAGMGLYLAQRLARLRYGGDIRLDAILPRGTCARLRLRPRERSA